MKQKIVLLIKEDLRFILPVCFLFPMVFASHVTVVFKRCYISVTERKIIRLFRIREL